MRKRKAIILLFVLTVAAIATLLIVCNREQPEQLTEVTPVVASPEVTTDLSVVNTTVTVSEMTTKKAKPEFTYNEQIPLAGYLQEAMQKACKKYGVPYALALAVAECESGFDLEADSGICWGVMQINPCNYSRLRELGIEPTEYEGNIVAGVFMLGELLNKYGDTHKALMAYNCGEAGAKGLWDQGYSTSYYSRKVTTQSEFWQQTLNQ